MKFIIKLEKGPIKIEIEDQIEDKSSIDFLKDILNLMEEKKDIIFSYLEENSINNENGGINQDPIELTFEEIENATSSGEKIEVLKISKDTKIDKEKIKMIIDFDETIHDVFPLINPIFQDKSRAKQQRNAILLFLYFNVVLNDNNSFSSNQLTKLIDKSNMDSRNLADCLRSDKSGVIKQEGRVYRITSIGLIEARKILNDITI